jgi:hypothetical protein
MSAAPAALPKRRLTPGWAKVPYYLIQNQRYFTPSEMSLALIVLRRGGSADTKVPDTIWESWTGNTGRSKELAAAGLRKKCLTIEGKGDKAVYRFDPDLWSRFVQEQEGKEGKAHTTKPGVDPKKGAKVHQQCRDKGCALLAASTPAPPSNSGLSLVPLAQNAKPVSQVAAGLDALAAAQKQGLNSGSKPLVAIQNAKQVSQKKAAAAPSCVDSVEQMWAETLRCLRAIFPLVGLAFLVRLVAVVRALFTGVSDAELAAAVVFAWNQKRRSQKSEGLFLLTVPDALRALRDAPPGPVEVKPHDYSAGALALLSKAREGIEKRGAPFAALLPFLDDLTGRVGPALDPVALDSAMTDLQALIVSQAAEVFTDHERKQVHDAVVSAMCRESTQNVAQLNHIRELYLERETLKFLGVPVLSLYYA